MPVCLCGPVIAGVHVFPPQGVRHQKPWGEERQRLVMMSPHPMPDLIVRSPGCTLAALAACGEALVGWGHTGQRPQRCPRRGVGQRQIDLHHLLVVAVAGASYASPLLVALVPPRRPRHPAACAHVDHQRPLGAVAHVAPLPGVRCKRCPRRLAALPGRRRGTAPPAGRQRRCRQGTEQRLARHRPPRAFTPAMAPATNPIRTPHLVIARDPPMREPRATGLQPVQRHRVPRAIPAVGGGHASFVQAWGRDRRLSTSGWPALDTSPRSTATLIVSHGSRGTSFSR